MRRSRFFSAFAGMLLGGSVAVKAAEAAAEKVGPSPPLQGAMRQFLMVIDLFRIDGEEANGTFSAQGSVSRFEEKSKPPSDRKEHAGYCMVFSEADFAADGLRFRAGKDGWTWNGKSDPPPAGPVQKIATPRIAAQAGQPFEIVVGSESPIQYFEKRPDGLFELKDIQEWTGIKMGATIDDGDGGDILIRDLRLLIQSVGERVPIEGVTLDVGPPLVARREVLTTLKVAADRAHGVLFMSEGRGLLLMRIVVSRTPPVESGTPPVPR